MWTPLSCPLWILFCPLPHSLSTDPWARITTIPTTNPTSLPLLWPQRTSTVPSAFATLCLAPALLPRHFRPSEINQWFPVLNLKRQQQDGGKSPVHLNLCATIAANHFWIQNTYVWKMMKTIVKPANRKAHRVSSKIF